MRELVIVISDLYLAEDRDRPEAGAPGGSDTMAVPGLEQIARFGTCEAVDRSWRSWLAAWVGRPDLAYHAPAGIAAAGFEAPGSAAAVWLATPVHFVAGLTRVHLDPRGLLSLPRATLERIAEDFDAAFAGSGWRLLPLEAGGFLAIAPSTMEVRTVDPARRLGSDIGDALPSGRDAAALRRLGTEIEMWLHDHPVNAERAERGQPPITGLWLWGGGAPAHGMTASATVDAAFGSDAYLAGLWRLCGARMQPLPQQFEELLGYAAPRAVLVLETTRWCVDENPWSLGAAVAGIDRQWITPAVDALRRGEMERVSIVANDRHLFVRRRDFVKRWRRPRRGLTGLQ